MWSDLLVFWRNEGKIQQLQAAYVLEQSCAAKECEFVLNTSDNFYAVSSRDQA